MQLIINKCLNKSKQNLLHYLCCQAVIHIVYLSFCSGRMLNLLDSKGNYSVTSNNTKLVQWPLMGGLLHLVQRRGPGRAAAPPSPSPSCTKCNSPPINGQCTNHCIAV